MEALSFLKELSESEMLLPVLLLTILLLWYPTKFGEYRLKVVDSSPKKRKASFMLIAVLFVPMAVIVTLIGLYIYLVEGMNWFTASVIALDVLITIGLKKEREKLKKYERMQRI